MHRYQGLQPIMSRQTKPQSVLLKHPYAKKIDQMPHPYENLIQEKSLREAMKKVQLATAPATSHDVR